MKGHQTKGALERDIKRQLKAGMSTDKIKEVYRISLLHFSIDDVNLFIKKLLFQTTGEKVSSVLMSSKTKDAFSSNEMDYGHDLPEYKFDELCKYEQSFASN